MGKVKQSTLNENVNLEAIGVYVKHLPQRATNALSVNWLDEPTADEQTTHDILKLAAERMAEALKLTTLATRLDDDMAYARIYDTAKPRAAETAQEARTVLDRETAPQTVHTVEVDGREDGVYLFADEADADRFVQAVNRAAGVDIESYGLVAIEGHAVISGPEETDKLIEQELEDVEEEWRPTFADLAAGKIKRKVPVGIAYPTNVGPEDRESRFGVDRAIIELDIAGFTSVADDLRSGVKAETVFERCKELGLDEAASIVAYWGMS